MRTRPIWVVLTTIAAVLTGLLVVATAGAVAGVTVTGFTPSGGVVGSTVQINGTGFTGATRVKIATSDVMSFTVDSDTMIHATVPTPTGAGGHNGKISVFTSHGDWGSSAQDFTIIVTPTIEGFAPGYGPVGSTVQIRGNDLDFVTGGSFNGTPITSFTISRVGGAPVVNAVVPVGATDGPIRLTNAAGTSAPSAEIFHVTPRVTGFSPTSGAKGSTVTISGNNFTGATKVRFGGVQARSFAVVDDTTIQAVVPPGAVTGPISVTNANGTGTSTATFTVTP
jgi:hypothetical protein